MSDRDPFELLRRLNPIAARARHADGRGAPRGDRRRVATADDVDELVPARRRGGRQLVAVGRSSPQWSARPRGSSCAASRSTNPLDRRVPSDGVARRRRPGRARSDRRPGRDCAAVWADGTSFGAGRRPAADGMRRPTRVWQWSSRRVPTSASVSVSRRSATVRGRRQRDRAICRRRLATPCAPAVRRGRTRRSRIVEAGSTSSTSSDGRIDVTGPFTPERPCAAFDVDPPTRAVHLGGRRVSTVPVPSAPVTP